MRQALSRLSENYEGPYSFFCQTFGLGFQGQNKKKRGPSFTSPFAYGKTRSKRVSKKSWSPDPPLTFSHAFKDFLFPIIPRIPFRRHFLDPAFLFFFARKRFKMSPTAKAKEELWMNLNALKKIFFGVQVSWFGKFSLALEEVGSSDDAIFSLL